jgi:septal ring factor EnvC (AmiA/AmiB activator)
LPKAAKIALLPKEEQAAAISRPVAQKQKEPVHVVDRSDELSELRHTVCDLAAENEALKDLLAVESMDALEEEKTQTVQIIHGLRAKVAELEAELSAVKVSRDTYQRENSELMKQCASQRKKLQKLGGE